MLLAHDLLLLLLDDETGRLHSAAVRQELLGGAVLIELSAGGWVDVAEKGGPVKRGRVHCLPVAAPADPILAAALARIAAELAGKRPDAVIRPLGKELPDRLTQDLVAAGLVRPDQHRVLGMFASTRYPVADDGYEKALRRRLAAVLAGAEVADNRTGPLLVMLGAVGLLTKLVPVADKRDARKLVRRLARADWASAPVRRAVLAVNKATAGAMAAG